jgi:hypothetical protein
LTSAVLDEAPSGLNVTEYDQTHAKLYLRLLDAMSSGAEWREAAELILGVDAEREPERARRCYVSHLARARWIADGGYLDLLRSGKS